MPCKISWLTQHPHQTDQLPSPQVRLVCLKVLTVKRKFHFPYSPPRKNEIDQSQLGVAALKKILSYCQPSKTKPCTFSTETVNKDVCIHQKIFFAFTRTKYVTLAPKPLRPFNIRFTNSSSAKLRHFNMGVYSD